MNSTNGIFDKHCDEFVAYMSKLKQGYRELNRRMDDADQLKQESKDKMAVIQDSYQRQVVMEAKAKKELENAEDCASNAKDYEDSKKELLDKVKAKEAQIDEGFTKLDKQRNDINETQKQILKRTKVLQMLERKVKADRITIDQLIFDKNLQDQFGDELGKA